MRMARAILTLGVALALAVPAAADWDPTQGSKWVQFPEVIDPGDRFAPTSDLPKVQPLLE